MEWNDLTGLIYWRPQSLNDRPQSSTPTSKSYEPMEISRPSTMESETEPASSSTSTARDQVIATPELLEAILLHLPLSDILTRIQLVSSYLHDTISTSASLRQALFFAPATASSPSQINPLLNHCQTAVFIDKRSRDFEERDRHCDNFPWPHNDALSPLIWMEYARRYCSYSAKGASWRNMLIVQPPIMELCLNDGATLRNRRGINMGQLETCLMDWSCFMINKDGKGSLYTTGQAGQIR